MSEEDRSAAEEERQHLGSLTMDHILSMNHLLLRIATFLMV